MRPGTLGFVTCTLPAFWADDELVFHAERGDVLCAKDPVIFQRDDLRNAAFAVCVTPLGVASVGARFIRWEE